MPMKNHSTSVLLINTLGNNLMQIINLPKKIETLYQLRKIIAKLDNCHFYGDQSALTLWR